MVGQSLEQSRAVISRDALTWTDPVRSPEGALVSLRIHGRDRLVFSKNHAGYCVARLAAFALSLMSVWTFGHSAEAARIHVHGAARLTAQASRSNGDLVISGALADDAGEPIARATIALGLSLAADDAAHPAGDFTDTSHLFHSCRSDQRGAPPSVSPPPKTDEAGEFCVRATLPPARFTVHLAWDGGALIDGAKLDVPVDLESIPLALRFDPAPRIVHLDGPVVLDLRARIASDTEAPATGLHLALTDERSQTLGETNSDSFGRAELIITPTQFAPPGLGSLTVTCSGEECPQGTHVTIDIERHALVQLTAHDEALRTNVQTPDDGLPLDVDVTTHVGIVTSGAIEARVGDTVVGAAPVANGKAHLVLTFAAATSGDAPIGIRYLPSAPWFEPGHGTIAHAQVKSKSGWHDSPFIAIGIVILAWLALGRVRAGGVKIPPEAAKKPDLAALPPLEVVKQADASQGFRGRVIDAHDGAPLANVEVGIERGGFAMATRLRTAMSDADGRFTLAPIEGAPGDALIAIARLHSDFRQPLPPSVVGGELAVRLTSRRRAILGRLIAWSRARVRGDARIDPTPAQVRRSAGTPEGQRWADAVERAAFGVEEVDARLEANVDALAPAKVAPSELPPPR